MKKPISSILQIAAITLATAFSGALAVAQPQQSTAVNIAESCVNLADGDRRTNSSAIQEELELENLADLKIKIESIKALGAKSDNAIVLTALNHDFKMKFRLILDKFVAFNLVATEEEFVARLREKIMERFGEAFVTAQAAAAVEASGRQAEIEYFQFIEFAQKARFYDLKPAKFSFESFDDRLTMRVIKRDIKIEHPFAMMDTDVSQAIWVWLKLLSGVTDLNDLNPSYYKSERDSPETFTLQPVGASEVGFVPDLPVEHMSKAQALDFVNELNKLSMNDDEKVHQQIRRAFPDHQRGSYYSLPTLEQMIFVQSNRGANTCKYFDGDLEGRICWYAWTGAEADSTRPVKSKQPRMIDTGYGAQVPFYDLTGNVWKLTKSTHLKWNQNPLDVPVDGSWAVTGGAVGSPASFTDLGVSWPQESWEKRFTGVRLVRYSPSLRPEIEQKELLEAQDKARRAQELHTALTQVHQFRDIIRKSHKLEFVGISPNDFVMRLRKWDPRTNVVTHNDVPAKLSRKFSMATTPVTQMVWSKVQLMLGERDPAKINPSKFSDGRQSLLVAEDGIQFHLRPDNPVEKIDPRSVGQWIRGLNMLSKNRSPGVQEMLKELIPGHERGDVYDLPVLSQMAFVVQNRGKNNLRFFDRDDPSEYSQYSVCSANSNCETRPVKSMKPRTIDTGDGQTAEFFDLIGDVEVMVKDLGIHVNNLEPHMLMSDKNKDPISAATLRACGTCYLTSDDADSKGAYLAVDHAYWSGSQTTGFRLVRYRERSFWRKFF